MMSRNTTKKSSDASEAGGSGAEEAGEVVNEAPPVADVPAFVTHGAAAISEMNTIMSIRMTPEVRQKHPELAAVFQLYAAEMPSILERQKRLEMRANQG